MYSFLCIHIFKYIILEHRFSEVGTLASTSSKPKFPRRPPTNRYAYRTLNKQGMDKTQAYLERKRQTQKARRLRKAVEKDLLQHAAAAERAIWAGIALQQARLPAIGAVLPACPRAQQEQEQQEQQQMLQAYREMSVTASTTRDESHAVAPLQGELSQPSCVTLAAVQQTLHHGKSVLLLVKFHDGWRRVRSDSGAAGKLRSNAVARELAAAVYRDRWMHWHEPDLPRIRVTSAELDVVCAAEERLHVVANRTPGVPAHHPHPPPARPTDPCHSLGGSSSRLLEWFILWSSTTCGAVLDGLGRR